MFFLAATLVGWIGGDFVYGKVAAKNIASPAPYGPLLEKMTSSTKPEVHYILKRRKRRTSHGHMILAQKMHRKFGR